MSATSFLGLGGTPSEGLLEVLAQEMAAVEQELARQLQSQVQLVSEVGLHTLKAGGKRLRPALVSVSARATGRDFDLDRARRLGACMEMIHMATLIHDDVIDNADTRRGVPTASATFGNTASILSGDVLLAKAMSILAQDGDIDIIRTVSSAVVELAEGEVRELETRGNFDLSEEAYFEILQMKTASFIECCCRVGAMVAGADEQGRRALGRFGHHVGLAFQIADDLLDYRGDSRTGKKRAGDFREGCATLPLIYLREMLFDAQRELLKKSFGNVDSEEDIDQICRWMVAKDAYTCAEEKARKHVLEAQIALEALPESDAKDLLCSVAEFVVLRQS